jgi:hypothetical protein
VIQPSRLLLRLTREQILCCIASGQLSSDLKIRSSKAHSFGRSNDVLKALFRHYSRPLGSNKCKMGVIFL